jgi:hypothetical protein
MPPTLTATISTTLPLDAEAAWRHRLLVVEVDPTRRLLRSRESGGPVSAWNHDIWLEPAGPAACRYTDRVEIAAGAWTPLIWAFAQVFYRYRQARWRRLARRAGGAGPA